jgi:hypothetical protein
MFPIAWVSTGFPVTRRSSDVTDGLSNTIAIGERSYPGATGMSFPVWLATHGFYYDGNNLDSDYPINCVSNFGAGYWRSARSEACALSSHPGVCQFAFGDGAVRPVSETIDRTVYRLLGAINDGKVVSVDF